MLVDGVSFKFNVIKDELIRKCNMFEFCLIGFSGDSLTVCFNNNLIDDFSKYHFSVISGSSKQILELTYLIEDNIRNYNYYLG